MEYLSHQDYTDLLKRLQGSTSKGVLRENVEEGNAFTAALAKAKKGEKVKVGGKEITDTSNYDNPSVEEYAYTDNYPGSWGYREGLNPAPMQATGQTISTVEEDSTKPSMGFGALTPTEREQLEEYIESMKTIKREIVKLAEKAGKKVKMEGGDMTGLTMTSGTMSENKIQTD